MLPAASADDVARQAAGAADIASLDRGIVNCRACPRLVEWRESVAAERRAAYRDEDYWGRPIPGFGDERPSVLIVGLAPAAHGGNRTGRVFTGDRSGDWLFASLHRLGVASVPWSRDRDDGQELSGVRIAAAVRCAPPANRPTPDERDRCAPWLAREVELCRPSLRALVALGGFAWQACLATLAATGREVPSPRPRFGHGQRAAVGDVLLVGSYHPSQQNTFTGRLTERMLDEALSAAIDWARVAATEGADPERTRR